MPIHFRIDRDCGCVVTEMWGDPTPREVLEYLEALRAHPDYTPALPRLIDLREFTHVGMTSDDIRWIVGAARDDPAAGPGRRAFVATAPVVYGMLRIFAALSRPETGEYEVFTSLDAARDWLRLPGATGGAGAGPPE